jgi:oligoribonuclease (3'-5' exoribonuclease)
MHFEILGDITNVETFAIGSSIREIARLRKMYGRGRWRKRKGIAHVRLEDGEERLAELHWYEAHGIGRKQIKIKRYID